MGKKKKRTSTKSIIRTVESLMNVANFVGPEVGTVWQDRSPSGLGQALALKSGIDPINRTVDFSNLIFGWGGYLTFNLVRNGIHKLNGIIRRL